MKFSDELINKAKSADSVAELKKLALDELSEDELSNVSGGGCGDEEKKETPAPQPVPKGYNDLCDNYVMRGGGGAGSYVKFFDGTHCESCYYFRTSSDWSDSLNPDHTGMGYCFHGLV